MRSLTPSRRNSAAAARAAVALTAIVLAAAGTRAHAAQAPARGDVAPAPAPARSAPARVDSVPHRSRPFFVMLRSAAVPGWGQMYNHKPLKAVTVVAAEGVLGFQAWRELQKENDAVDRQSAILDAGGDPSDPAYLLAAQDQEEHRNRKINWIWWGLAAHLLSMMDAYVDAHLATFDADFGTEESARDSGEKPRLTVALRTRF